MDQREEAETAAVPRADDGGAGRRHRGCVHGGGRGANAPMAANNPRGRGLHVSSTGEALDHGPLKPAVHRPGQRASFMGQHLLLPRAAVASPQCAIRPPRLASPWTCATELALRLHLVSPTGSSNRLDLLHREG